jgi:hypothetical protein
MVDPAARSAGGFETGRPGSPCMPACTPPQANQRRIETKRNIRARTSSHAIPERPYAQPWHSGPVQHCMTGTEMCLEQVHQALPLPDLARLDATVRQRRGVHVELFREWRKFKHHTGVALELLQGRGTGSSGQWGGLRSHGRVRARGCEGHLARLAIYARIPFASGGRDGYFGEGEAGRDGAKTLVWRGFDNWRCRIDVGGFVRVGAEESMGLRG